jgi:hypothetical protein
VFHVLWYIVATLQSLGQEEGDSEMCELWSYERWTRGNRNGNRGKYTRSCGIGKLCKTFQFWSRVQFPCLTPAFSTQQEKRSLSTLLPRGAAILFSILRAGIPLEYRFGRLVTRRDEPSSHYIFTTYCSTPATFILAPTPRLPLQSCPAQKTVQPCFSALNSQPISFGRR